MGIQDECPLVEDPSSTTRSNSKDDNSDDNANDDNFEHFFP